MPTSAPKQVTQTTIKTATVAIHAYRGLVNTVALTDAADTSFEFSVNNAKVRPNSMVLLTPVYAGSTGTPTVRIKSQSKGVFVVRVTNVGTAVLNASLGINFQVQI